MGITEVVLVSRALSPGTTILLEPEDYNDTGFFRLDSQYRHTYFWYVDRHRLSSTGTIVILMFLSIESDLILLWRFDQ